MSLASPARPLALPRPRPLAAGGLLGACLLTAAPAALAQAALPVAAASAPVQALTAEQLQAERRRAQAAGEPAGYQDRYLDAAELGALTQQAEAEAAADDGAPRAWLVETRLGGARGTATGSPSRSLDEAGARLEYRQQTLNYGEWLLQADGRLSHGDSGSGLGGLGWWGAAPHDSGGRLTLRNLGFAAGGGWLLDSRLGDGFSDVTRGLVRQQRLGLGASTVRGVAAHLYRRDTEVRAGWGLRGYLAGGPYPGFERHRARSAGWAPRTGWAAPATGSPPASWAWRATSRWTTSALGARPARRRAGRTCRAGRWRASLLGSQARGDARSVDAQALSLEAERRWGRYAHAAGLRVGRPGLYFGDQRLFGGDQGAFWRVDYGGTRLAWGLGLDLERARADPFGWLPAFRRASLSGHLHYQLSRDTSFGGNLALQRGHYDGLLPGALDQRARSWHAYAFYQTRWGGWPRTRLSLTARDHQQIALGSSSATGQELQWEQDWIGGRLETQQPELTSTLGYAWDRSDGRLRRYPTAGLQWRYWVGGRGFVGGNLRYTSQSGGLSTSRGLSGQVNGEYEVAPGWRLGLQVGLNQARTALVPAGWDGPLVYRSQERSAYVFLRWEGQAGRPYAVIGQSHGPGSGRIVGRVFFDANGDGQRQADEAGVPQVEVLLAGRYPVRTDQEGRFEFPLVASGRQRLALTLDSVPLPWGVPGEGTREVEVPLRGLATLDIPVVRGAP